MIDAASELDAKPQARTAGRRALIATLVYAGLRTGEATALTWQDIDLANGRISVGDSKTEAGIRLVDILPALRDELLSHRQTHAEAGPDALVFPTSSGSRRDKDNARERVIRPVVAHADRVQRGRRPLQRKRRNPRIDGGFPQDGRGWVRTSDLSRVKRALSH
jgi:integrase